MYHHDMSRIAPVVCIAWLSVVVVDRALGAPPDDSEGRALLGAVEDNTFSFDDEAFYWYCRYLRANPDAYDDVTCGAGDAVPWRFLMERPSDYRGRAVCIEGRLLREQPSYEIAGRPGVGRLRQLELGRSGSNAVATLILLDAAPTIAKRSRIRARAVFIKVRAFQSEAGKVGSGPLLIASGLDVVESSGPAADSAGGMDARRLLPWMAGVTLLLFGVMVAIRRNVGAKRQQTDLAIDEPRVTGTDADFDWLGLGRDADADSDERNGASSQHGHG